VPGVQSLPDPDAGNDTLLGRQPGAQPDAVIRRPQAGLDRVMRQRHPF
jgi:hypothetical protein